MTLVSVHFTSNYHWGSYLGLYIEIEKNGPKILNKHKLMLDKDFISHR